MNVEVDFGAVNKLATRLATFVGLVDKVTMKEYDKKMGEKLLASVIRHASGRPGPNIVTGRYVSQFRLVNNRVVNDSLQTYRLEYGFSGTDSLGRQYHQPPLPHFRPALEEMREEYRRGIVPLLKSTWNSTA